MSGYTDESARMDELAKAVLLAKQSSYVAHRHVPDRQVKKELEDALSQVNFATHFAVLCPPLRALRCSARYVAFASVENRSQGSMRRHAAHGGLGLLRFAGPYH